MPVLLGENLPEALKSVRTRPLFVLREQIPPLIASATLLMRSVALASLREALLRVTACPARLLRATTGRRFARIIASGWTFD